MANLNSCLYLFIMIFDILSKSQDFNKSQGNLYVVTYTFSIFFHLVLVARWLNGDQKIATCLTPTVLLDDLLVVGSTLVLATPAAAVNRVTPQAPVCQQVCHNMEWGRVKISPLLFFAIAVPYPVPFWRLVQSFPDIVAPTEYTVNNNHSCCVII